MYRIGLVDDEAEYIAQLKAAIERYAAACQPPIQLKVDTYDDAIHLILFPDKNAPRIFHSGVRSFHLA